jgi:cytochrome b561
MRISFRRGISLKSLHPLLVITAMVLLFLVPAGGALAEGDEGPLSELHCYLGVVAFVLLVLAIGTGFLFSGRFGRIKGLKVRSVHMAGTLAISIFITGEFLYGVFAEGGGEFLDSIHGVLGLLLVIFAWAATGLSPCTIGKAMNRRLASRAHAIAGLVLVVLTAVQVVYAYMFLG